jgi:hypothetical protein
VVVVHIFGDGFGIFRSGKYVNFCLRVCGMHELAGSAASCGALGVVINYDDVVKERGHSAVQLAPNLQFDGEHERTKGRAGAAVMHTLYCTAHSTSRSRSVRSRVIS